MKLKVSGTHYKFNDSKRIIHRFIELAYFNVLFPEDVILWGDKIEVVKEVLINMDYSGYSDDQSYYLNEKIYYPKIRVDFYKYSIDNYAYIPHELHPSMVLHKRPFKNWVKFIILLITKKYA